MAQTIFGAEYAVTVLNRAFNNGSPGNPVFKNQVKTAGDSEATQYAFAANFAKSFANVSNADLAKQVLTNLGVLPSDVAEVQALESALADVFGTVSTEDRGIVVLQLGSILSGLETATGDLAVYAPAAKAWNVEVERGYNYSSDEDNTLPQSGDFDAGAVTLTRETDVATSSVFNGYLDYNKYTGADEGTLTTGDRLTGTDGDSDILFAQISKHNDGARPTLNGIEIISIDAKAGNVGIDLSDTKGAKTLVNKGSHQAAGLTFDQVGNVVGVRVESTSADTIVNFTAPAVAGTSDNVDLTLNGVGIPADRPDVTLAGGNIESLTITSTGAANQLNDIVSAGTKTVTISGDQALRATLTAATIATLDASAATGKLNLNVAASGAEDQTITLGSADDNVTVTGLTAKDTITGGDGTDRVTLADTGTNEATKMVGVEQIGVTVDMTNINLVNAADVNLIAVKEVAGGITVNNVTAARSGLTFAFEGEGGAAAVDGKDANFGDVKFNLANATGKSDVINFTFGNAGVEMAKDAVVNIGTLNNSGNNVETLNFTFSDLVASNTVTIADINAGAATALNTLNFTSNSKVVVNNVTDLDALTKVDATGVKAGFVATFGSGTAATGLAAAADVTILLGGSGKNNVTATHSEQTGATLATSSKMLTLDGSAGTGVQTLTLNNLDVNTNLAANNGYTAVVRGGSGGDTINVNAATVGADTLVAAGAGIDTINLTGDGRKLIQLSLGDTGSTVASADTVNGFDAVAQDKIDLRNFGFDVSLQGVTAAAGALDGQANEFGGKAVAAAVVGGNTQVYVDTNGDDRLSDGDLVIVLNGVAAGFDNADVVWF